MNPSEPIKATAAVRTAGKSSTPASQQYFWADQSDDEPLNPEVQLVHAHKKRVKELEAIVDTNAALIRELEGKLKVKDDIIEDLKDDLELKIKLTNDAEETTAKSEKEKTIIIQEYEDTIASLNEQIRELEAAQQVVSPVPSEPLTPSTAVEYAVSEHTDSDVTPSKKGSERTSSEEVPEHTTSKQDTPGTPTEKIHELSKEDYPSLSKPGAATSIAAKNPEPTLNYKMAKNGGATPTPRDDGELVFATPQTIKKTAPVPPAPVLKMGIDMSNWGKKPAAKAGSTYKGQGRGSVRYKVDPKIVPTINPDRDVRKMSRFERGPLGNGGDIEIKMGNQDLGKVPKYMLMQCSLIANKYLTDHSKAKTINFPDGSMDVASVKIHIDWMQQHCHVGRVFSIGLHSEHTDVRNLNIVRASRVLGLNNTYVGHFTKQYCDKIRDQDLSYELMDLIASLAYPDNDPIFDCLANNIAKQRNEGNVTDPEGLHAFLLQHPILADRVDKIERRYAPTPKGQPFRGSRSGAPNLRNNTTQ